MSSPPEEGWVLDASALLAMIQGEPGGDRVAELVEGAVLSAINLAEVLQKSIQHGTDVQGLRRDLEALGLEILPFTTEHAESVATLWPETRSAGLSLADRACLAVARERGWTVVTTDRSWQRLSLDITMEHLR